MLFFLIDIKFFFSFNIFNCLIPTSRPVYIRAKQYGQLSSLVELWDGKFPWNFCLCLVNISYNCIKYVYFLVYCDLVDIYPMFILTILGYSLKSIVILTLVWITKYNNMQNAAADSVGSYNTQRYKIIILTVCLFCYILRII